MKTYKFRLKNDRYRRARGGYARFLNVYCSNCKYLVFLYQKDGPGILKRAYLDRVLAPQSLVNLQKKERVRDIPTLKCPNCGAVIGKPYIYEKEKRKSFLLVPTAFIKKLGKGIYLQKA